jgi:uncharacterized protein (DUF433 family)
MLALPKLLTPTEAAVVSGVSVRDINRAIDESILPDQFVRLRNGRHVLAAACSLIAFYFQSADRLTSAERLWVIKTLAPRLRKSPTSAALWKEDWTLRHEFLTIDLTPFLRNATERLARLEEARAAVAASPEILGGTPVIRSTRVPVYDVAASVAAGISVDRILSAYPSLNGNDVELAAIYAEAVPARGRPRRDPQLPKDTLIITDRHIPRRQKAG